MSRPSAIFRCDASHEIGSGHVMRCLTIANYLRERGWTCLFSVSEGTVQAAPLLGESGFRIIGPDERLMSDIVFIDNYAMSYNDDHSYRKFTDRIIVLDDLANRKHDCDVLLDQTFSRERHSYKDLLPDNSIILTGSGYATLRTQFLAARKLSYIRRKETAGKTERVLISLGGTDPHNVTSLILEGLKGIDIAIDVVIGSGFPHLHQVKSLISSMSEQGAQIRVHQNVLNMAELMRDADLAIGAGGTTSWERCCLGLPTIMIELADNQRGIANALSQYGCVYNLGWYKDVTPDLIAQVFNDLKNDPARVVSMTEKALTICDGRGLDKLAPYFIAPIDGVQLVLMSESDVKILHDWQLFPGTRKFARNPTVPSWDDHVRWFQDTLNNPDRYIYKIMKGDAEAGMLRLDRQAAKERVFEISILIAPNFYGQGVASVALDFIRKLDPAATFMAEVHIENEASRRLFLKAGFIPISETWFEQKRVV